MWANCQGLLLNPASDNRHPDIFYALLSLPFLFNAVKPNFFGQSLVMRFNSILLLAFGLPAAIAGPCKPSSSELYERMGQLHYLIRFCSFPIERCGRDNFNSGDSVWSRLHRDSQHNSNRDHWDFYH
jgi:hypothetical protein